ncbi:MAG: hypothetical protein SFX19_04610 [Alphaproteobacteria bacterium]|nr:hypothetical protein [Alphaproteobacteria bacterium]
MRTITFEISSAFEHLLAEKGIASELAKSEFLEQLLRTYADDLLLGQAATEAKNGGYIGTDASAQLLQDMLNAKD